MIFSIGEKLHFTARFKEGFAKENGAYNVVSTAAYANSPDKSTQADTWNDIEVIFTRKRDESKDIDYEKKLVCSSG